MAHHTFITKYMLETKYGIGPNLRGNFFLSLFTNKKTSFENIKHIDKNYDEVQTFLS